MAEPTAPGTTRVMLRPVASSLPLGFLALALATVPFAAVQLGWVVPTEGRVAAIGAIAATVPLQLLASVFGFLARDVVAATGMGVLAGTWGTVGLVTATSPPGSVSRVGLVLGAVAVYAALALSLESTHGRTLLPLGRRTPAEPAGEPGVRPQL
jgi:succinate-acetate transporter protein